MYSHINKVPQAPQWAMFRSTAPTAANGVVPLVLRGQDASNSFTVSGSAISLRANKTYVIRAGLPNDSSTAVKGIEVQRSLGGGVAWGGAWGSLSGATGGTSAGTSVTDVFSTTASPTSIRLTAGANGLAAGAWLYIEVK